MLPSRLGPVLAARAVVPLGSTLPSLPPHHLHRLRNVSASVL